MGRDWSNIPFIEGRDYCGDYMKIMIGDDSGELAFYGVLIDIRWTEPEYPFRPLKKPFFTFISKIFNSFPQEIFCLT